jgi:hypothetical protein
MPSPTTILDIITKAMMHIGAIASGETPTADEAKDGLAAFNDVLETLSLEEVAVYASDFETFATIGGQAEYTIGVGGTFNTQRPVSMISDAYITISGVDFSIQPWSLSEYGQVSIKSQQAQIPERIVYVNDFPLGNVILWPTPSNAYPISLNFGRVLTLATSVSQAISYPPGYARLLQYMTAVELTPQYGGAIDVSGQAIKILSKIKMANRQRPTAKFDSALLGQGRVIGVRGY